MAYNFFLSNFSSARQISNLCYSFQKIGTASFALQEMLTSKDVVQVFLIERDS